MPRELLTVKGIDCLVDYDVVGQYFPATRYEPEEHPFIDILSIEVLDEHEDVNIKLFECDVEQYLFKRVLDSQRYGQPSENYYE